MSTKKVLLLVIFVLFLLGSGVVAFLFFPNEPPPLTSPLQPTVTPITNTPTIGMLEADTKTISSIVAQFYSAYTNCLASPSAQARGRRAVYCQENTGVTSDAFVKNLAEQGSARRGVDPITCSQNPPSSTTVETIDYEAPDRAVATTVTVFGAGFAQKIPVIVVKENNAWKVDTITCPK